ncbi:MAG: hypothetical protein QOI73_2401 [Solirubrobacteraceae bacterium]|nr:hypothetical protein [Solirubrobacteraceae bacterium]
MTLHQNAKTCPASRVMMARRVLEEGWSLAAAAEAAGVSERRCSEWVRRYRQGDHELADRSSAPRRVPNKTTAERENAIRSLRELRFTAAEIAETLGMAHSTVSAVLKRCGMGRLPRLDEGEPDNRYERAMPGELMYIDVKKLGRIGRPGHRVNGDRRTRSRGIGWEYVHVCVDDCTRLAYVEVLDDERTPTVCAFLQRAIAWFAACGVIVQRLMTDNGSAYRSHQHRDLCRQLQIKHLFTEPYRRAPTAKQSASSAPSPKAGTRRDLPQQPRTTPRTARLARSLQPHPTAPSAGRTTTRPTTRRTEPPTARRAAARRHG